MLVENTITSDFVIQFIVMAARHGEQLDEHLIVLNG